MNCETVGRWLDPLLDGELDSRNTVEVQAHLDGCPACQARYEAKRAVFVNLRRLDVGYAAPASLRARISAALEAEEAGARAGLAQMSATPRGVSAPQVSLAPVSPTAGQPRPRSVPTSPGSRWFLWAGWPVALAASALLATTLLHQRDQEADTIVAAHVRSLLANHLSDVESTSHHTVKPWFAGRIDFSPPVPDLSGLGFELIGGRLDYLEHRPVAAVVYRKHGHVINVLVSRPGGDLGALPQVAREQGYTLRSWKQGGLDVVAISDIDPSELATLQQGYEAPAPLTPEPPNTP
jgi:anti-sigma factor RsiW